MQINFVSIFVNKKYISGSLIFSILIAGIFLRLASANFERIPNVADEVVYINAANSLIKHGYLTLDRDSRMGFGEVSSNPTSALGAGYPAFLAGIIFAFGNNSKFLIAANVSLAIVAFLFSAFILNDLPIKRISKIIGLSMIAVYPGFLYNNDRVLTEPLFSALFLGFFWTYLKGLHKPTGGWLIFAGVLIGMAIQVRPFALPFFLLACIFLITYRTHGVRSTPIRLLYLSGPVLFFMFAWVLFNWSIFGTLKLLPDSGQNPQVWGAMPYFLDMGFTESRNLQQLIEINQAANSDAFLKWRIFGFFQYMWGDIWDENLVHPQWYLQPLIVMQLFIVVPTVVALPIILQPHRPSVLFIASAPLAFTLMCMPFHGLPRYVWPSLPLVFIALAILIDRLSGSSLPKVCFKDQISRRFSTLMHATLIAVYLPFSLILTYSIYFFAWSIESEMSEVRLSRYYQTSINTIEKLTPSYSVTVTPEMLTVENATKISTNRYLNDIDAIPIIRLTKPVPMLNGDAGRTVTKVRLSSSENYLFNFMTIYWIGKKTKEFSENNVYGRFPINFFEDEQVVYIDDDVTNVLLVPAGFRGSTFTVTALEISKFVVN